MILEAQRYRSHPTNPRRRRCRRGWSPHTTAPPDRRRQRAKVTHDGVTLEVGAVTVPGRPPLLRGRRQNSVAPPSVSGSGGSSLAVLGAPGDECRPVHAQASPVYLTSTAARASGGKQLPGQRQTCWSTRRIAHFTGPCGFTSPKYYHRNVTYPDRNTRRNWQHRSGGYGPSWRAAAALRGRMASTTLTDA